jgi:hypothetical protein
LGVARPHRGCRLVDNRAGDVHAICGVLAMGKVTTGLAIVGSTIEAAATYRARATVPKERCTLPQCQRVSVKRPRRVSDRR